MSSPLARITRHRRQLEAALLRPGSSPEELLAMSQQLDRLINHTMRVRDGSFSYTRMRARRRRVNRVLP